MPETLTFAKVHFYDTAKPGITVIAELRRGATAVQCEAKIDTGASFCIFQRLHGEYLDIESGTP